MGLFELLFGKKEEVSNEEVKTEDVFLSEEDKQRAYDRAIESQGLSLEYESEAVRYNRDFIMSLLDRDVKIYIKDIGKDLRDDEELVIKALRDEADNIQWASDRLKNDKDVCMAVLYENHNLLTGFEGESIRNDYDFMMKLIKEYNWENIKYASQDLKRNKDICREAYKGSSRAKDYFDNEILNNTEFMKELENL